MTPPTAPASPDARDPGADRALAIARRVLDPRNANLAAGDTTACLADIVQILFGERALAAARDAAARDLYDAAAAVRRGAVRGHAGPLWIQHRILLAALDDAADAFALVCGTGRDRPAGILAAGPD